MPRMSMESESVSVDDEGVIRCSRYRPIVISAVPAIGKKRYLPVREMIWPEEIETTSMPAIIGSRYTPEIVGEMPLTTWKKAGRKAIAPNMAKPTMKPTTLVTEKERSLNRCSGRIGSAARRSASTNRPISTTPAMPRMEIAADAHGEGVPRRRVGRVGGGAA